MICVATSLRTWLPRELRPGSSRRFLHGIAAGPWHLVAVECSISPASRHDSRNSISRRLPNDLIESEVVTLHVCDAFGGVAGLGTLEAAAGTPSHENRTCSLMRSTCARVSSSDTRGT